MKITRVEPFHVNLHFVASLTHSHHPAEYNGPREIQDVVFKTPVRPTRGKFALSDAPGLGPSSTRASC